MKSCRKVLFALTMTAVVVGLLVGFSGDKTAAQQDPTPKSDPQVDPAKQSQADLAKDTATQETPKKETPKPEVTKLGPQLITMAEAVTIAEKMVKGYTLKAERLERPQVSFRIEIVGMDGTRKEVELTAEGKATLKKATATKTPTKKGGDKKRERERERERDD